MLDFIFRVINVLWWVVAILFCVFGVFTAISMFIDSSTWKKIWAVIIIIISAFVFARSYAWLESISFSLFASGGLLCLLSGEYKDTSPKRERKPGALDAIVDTLCEYEMIKDATKEAIRESKWE